MMEDIFGTVEYKRLARTFRIGNKKGKLPP